MIGAIFISLAIILFIVSASLFIAHWMSDGGRACPPGQYFPSDLVRKSDIIKRLQQEYAAKQAADPTKIQESIDKKGIK